MHARPSQMQLRPRRLDLPTGRQRSTSTGMSAGQLPRHAALLARCGLHQVRMLGADRAEAESQIFATVVRANSDRLRLFKADHQCGIPKPARAGHNRRGKPVTLSRMCEFPQNQFGKAQMIDKARPIFLSPTAIDVQEADRTPADDATRGSGEYSEVAELLGKRTG